MVTCSLLLILFHLSCSRFLVISISLLTCVLFALAYCVMFLVNFPVYLNLVFPVVLCGAIVRSCLAVSLSLCESCNVSFPVSFVSFYLFSPSWVF